MTSRFVVDVIGRIHEAMEESNIESNEYLDWILDLLVREPVEFLQERYVCEICGNTELSIESNHIAGRAQSNRRISVCLDCHRCLSTWQCSWDPRWKRTEQPTPVVEAFLLMGLLDILRLRSTATADRNWELVASRLYYSVGSRLEHG